MVEEHVPLLEDDEDGSTVPSDDHRQDKWLQLEEQRHFATVLDSIWSNRHSIRRSLRHRRRSALVVLCIAVTSCFLSIVALITTVALVFPSYHYPPQHYYDLALRSSTSDRPGRGNIHNERVLIAASLHDMHGDLANGFWGNAVLELIQLLGPDNVHLSIYENDVDQGAKAALAALKLQLPCNSSLATEKFNYEEFPHVVMPSGESKISRVAFLADVRNRALRPLMDETEGKQERPFEKILFLNDIAFQPMDAVQLLFSTNVDSNSGRADYLAACAVDFINPFKLYDTFATRDFEGNEIGIPFYPWFVNEGEAVSRRDVQAQSDAVRVKSCWGGMVAFDATWFVPSRNASTASGQSTISSTYNPVQFRAEHEGNYWEASECCLIHADLIAAAEATPECRYPNNAATGIFMNPYIRVAYDWRTLAYLAFTSRFERLYPFIHGWLSHAVGMPHYNPRLNEAPGQLFQHDVWTLGNNSAPGIATPSVKIQEQVIARPGGYCGKAMFSVLNEHPQPGQARWETLWPPASA